MKNTEEYVNIHIAGVQKSGAEENKTDNFFEGRFFLKNDAYYITYEECDDNNQKTRVFLKIDKNRTTVRRMGEFSSVMEFSEGEMTEFYCKTPFGNIKMQVKTEKIVNKLSLNGGILKIFYTIIIGGEETDNRITLDVKLRSDVT